jgi:hypothetical protein
LEIGREEGQEEEQWIDWAPGRELTVGGNRERETRVLWTENYWGRGRESWTSHNAHTCRDRRLSAEREWTFREWVSWEQKRAWEKLREVLWAEANLRENESEQRKAAKEKRRTSIWREEQFSRGEKAMFQPFLIGNLARIQLIWV